MGGPNLWGSYFSRANFWDGQIFLRFKNFGGSKFFGLKFFGGEIWEGQFFLQFHIFWVRTFRGQNRFQNGFQTGFQNRFPNRFQNRLPNVFLNGLPKMELQIYVLKIIKKCLCKLSKYKFSKNKIITEYLVKNFWHNI